MWANGVGTLAHQVSSTIPRWMTFRLRSAMGRTDPTIRPQLVNNGHLQGQNFKYIYGMEPKPTIHQVDLGRRRNHVHAAYVNAALVIKELLGPRRAEVMLADEGVSQEVIVRMLNGFCKVR